MVFGIGAIISILILSIGNNRVRDTFIAYADSYNLDKRVIRQFELADYKIYRDSDTLSYEEVDTSFSANNLLNPDIKDMLKVDSFLKNAWVNRKMSDRESYPQIFVLDNVVGNQNQRLHCRYYDMEKREKTRYDELEKKWVTELKRVSIVDYIKLEKDIPISSRSYVSYLYVLGIFLLIMIPVIFFCRRLIRKIGLKDESYFSAED